MTRTSVAVGLLLIVLGIAGYVLTDRVSPTALIPAAFGLVILLLGIVGAAPARRPMAMHVAMGVALVGLIGSATGLMATLNYLIAHGSFEGAGAAPMSKALMATLLIVYLALGIQSFIKARAARSGSR